MANVIHQFIAGAGVGDAITNYAFEMQKIFIEFGFDSVIFCPEAHIAREYKTEKVKGINDIPEFKGNEIVIYHYSIGSDLTKAYKEINAKKVICYHNITPKEFYNTLSPEQAEKLENGRKELKELKNITQLSLAVSDYNRKELDEMGFLNTEVVPLVFPREYLNTKPDKNVLDRYNDENVNLLFVGRVVPNKRFEDLIKIFSVYHHTINPKSRLFLVGSYVGNEKYYTYLKSLIFDYRLTGNVVFSGHVTLEELIAYYHLASAFLCVSRHEGFGLPLIESMNFKIPVFALNKAAVPETLGGAGVLIQELHHVKIAELIDVVLNDSDLVTEIIKTQNERLDYFTNQTLKNRLQELFSKYLEIKI
jgi:glycosyltransferase involved in cell wall biosynthesis